MVELSLAAERAGDRIHVEIPVADRGLGVSEPLREAIFQPSSGASARGKGAGLGLALSR